MRHIYNKWDTMQKVYIETTLFNFYFADKGRQYYGRTVRLCQDTKRFFEAVRVGLFEPYTSEYVEKEIKRSRSAERRDEMLQLILDYDITVLPEDDETEWLAEKYIEAGAIPREKSDDAMHIAFTTVHGLDFIVSLNFEHIVKDKALRITAMVNEAEGYESIGIYEPGELIDGERP